MPALKFQFGGESIKKSREGLLFVFFASESPRLSQR